MKNFPKNTKVQSTGMQVFYAFLFCLGLCFRFSSVSAETIQYSYDIMGRMISIKKEEGRINHNYDAMDNLLIRTTSTSSGVNHPPLVPSSPSPANQAEGVETGLLLQWTGGDEDPDDLVLYAIYFGATEDPPLLISGLSGTGFQLPSLKSYTTYYWRVVAEDNHHNVTIGPLWSFTTGNRAPQIADVFPQPDQEVYFGSVYLSWQAEDPDGDSLVYDVYFGTALEPELVASDLSDSHWNLGALLEDTSYSWRVVVKDAHGASTTSPIYEFTTNDHEPVQLTGVISSDRTLISAEGPYISRS